MGVIVVEVYEILVRRLRRGYDQWSHPLPYLQKEGKKLKNYKDCLCSKCLRVMDMSITAIHTFAQILIWAYTFFGIMIVAFLVDLAAMVSRCSADASGAILISFFHPATLLAIAGTSLLKVLELVRKTSQRDSTFEIISFGFGMALFYFYERYIFEPQNIVACGWIPLAICVAGKLLELLSKLFLFLKRKNNFDI